MSCSLYEVLLNCINDVSLFKEQNQQVCFPWSEQTPLFSLYFIPRASHTFLEPALGYGQGPYPTSTGSCMAHCREKSPRGRTSREEVTSSGAKLLIQKAPRASHYQIGLLRSDWIMELRVDLQLGGGTGRVWLAVSSVGPSSKYVCSWEGLA